VNNAAALKLTLSLLTLALLLVSWWAPLFTMTQLWLFEDRVSMLSVVATLFESANYFLLLLVASASMLLPLLKALLILFKALPNGQLSLSSRANALIKQLSRWAMLDIWVVALMIVVIKLSAWADAQVEWGLYLHLLVVALLWWQNRPINQPKS
jgi:paraquat-inducible protein A